MLANQFQRCVVGVDLMVTSGYAGVPGLLRCRLMLIVAGCSPHSYADLKFFVLVIISKIFQNLN